VKLADLEAFAAAADTQSLTTAAARLGSNEHALSRRIRRLEDDLGVRLIDRTHPAVTLTPAGHALLPEARATLAAAQAARQAATGAPAQAAPQAATGAPAQAAPQAPTGAVTPPPPTGATWAALAEAIALVAARHQDIPSPGLSGDIDANAVAAALAILAAAFLGKLLPADRAASLLTDLGLAAARQNPS
jgi:DNA-binding transcriptional LysR family regulator